MNRKSITITIVLTIILAFSAVNAQQYVYVSNTERDNFNDFTYLAPGVYHGSIHSNTGFAFRYLPLQFKGFVTSSSDRNFFWGIEPEDVEMAHDPLFDMSAIRLSNNAEWIRRNANPFISDRNGQLMTWIVGRGEAGIDVYQYPRGLPPTDSLYVHMNPPVWQAVFVDGDCEVNGRFCGNLTIGCSGDMYLLDNVLYAGADSETGDFDDESMMHNLGLVAEHNVFIANTIPNGRADGANAEPDNPDRHSIAINGIVAALGGSVRIEDSNDEDDLYQGPTPDERGTIYLKGCIFTRYGAKFWNTNHQGTGYNVNFQGDNRFAFYPEHIPFINIAIPIFLLGHNNPSLSVYVQSGNTAIVSDNSTVQNLTMAEVSNLLFVGADSVIINNLLRISGTEANPVHFFYLDWEEGMPRAIVTIGDFTPREAMVNYLVCDAGVELHLEAIETHLANSTIASPVYLRGERMAVSDNRFSMPVLYDGWRYVEMIRNLFQAGLTIDGNPRQCNIDHCTITNPGGAGLFLDLYREVNISNSIIANCEAGIVNDHWETPAILYSDIYGNSEGDLVDCNPGEGCVSLDPLFVDAMNGDYHLQPGSPCVDAGDPNSPNDPDDSRADMGAFPFDHAQDIAHDATMPSAFVLSSPFPNPFNSTTTIGYSLPAAGAVSLTVYDLSGREVARLAGGVKTAGTHSVSFNGDGMASGVYVVKLVAGGVSAREKVVLVR